MREFVRARGDCEVRIGFASFPGPRSADNVARITGMGREQEKGDLERQLAVCRQLLSEF
jgi:hypothetical protein